MSLTSKISRRLFLGRAGVVGASLAATPTIAPAKPAPYDDGPLRSDDVTGTNAFELYAAGDPNWRTNARKTGLSSLERSLRYPDGRRVYP